MRARQFDVSCFGNLFQHRQEWLWLASIAGLGAKKGAGLLLELAALGHIVVAGSRQAMIDDCSG
jgi:hypothetical protein